MSNTLLNSFSIFISLLLLYVHTCDIYVSVTMYDTHTCDKYFILDLKIEAISGDICDMLFISIMIHKHVILI